MYWLGTCSKLSGAFYFRGWLGVRVDSTLRNAKCRQTLEFRVVSFLLPLPNSSTLSLSLSLSLSPLGSRQHRHPPCSCRQGADQLAWLR